MPYDHDEYAVAEVSDRLREFAAFLEDATHQKLDEAALQQAVAHSSRTLELLQQAQAAKAGRNLHNDVTSEFYEVFVTHTMLGTPQAEQYARKLLADIEASPMGGGTRLLWAHAVPFYQAPVRERLNFSAENQLITCDMNADALGCCMDPDKPFESMAARLVNNIFNGSAQHRIQRALELCRMQQINGVVYFCQWGCKQTMGAAQLFKSALEAEGYPVLLLDGDGCDRANTMDGQTATRLDAFLEMLHSKQGGAGMSKTIYYACKYAPLELFAGYGATFSALDPLAESFSCAERCAHANLCGYAKAVLEQVEQSGIRALVLTNCCDAMLRVYDVLAASGKMEFLQLLPVPHQSTPATRARFARDLRRLADALQRYTGQKFDAQRAHAFLCTNPTPRVRI